MLVRIDISAILFALATAWLMPGAYVCVSASEEIRLVLACTADNDLFHVLAANEIACRRFDSPAQAVQAADSGDGVLILADRYPETTTAIDLALFEQAAKKQLRLYVEYPAALPGVEVGQPIGTHVGQGKKSRPRGGWPNRHTGRDAQPELSRLGRGISGGWEDRRCEPRVGSVAWLSRR